MPTYEYECKTCGHTFDVFQSMSDEPVKTCPKCGKEVRRLINGGSGIIFKGSGFYVTDKGKSSAAGVGSSGGSAKPKTETPAGSGDTAAKTPAAAAPSPAAPAPSAEKAAG